MKRYLICLAFILMLFFLIPSLIFAQATEPETTSAPPANPTDFQLLRGYNNLYSFLSAGNSGAAFMHEGEDSPILSLFNPASGALRGQYQVEVSGMVFGGFGTPFAGPASPVLQPDYNYFGDVIGVGFSAPSEYGTWTVTAHHLQSLSTAMSTRNQGMFSLSWAMPVLDNLAVGAGVKGVVSSTFTDGNSNWAIAGDLGLIWYPIHYQWVEDLSVSFAFQNFGWGTIMNESSWFPLATPTLGVGFSFYKEKGYDFRMAANISAPALQTFEASVGFDFEFIDSLSLAISSTLAVSDFDQSLLPSTAKPINDPYVSFIPSITFRYQYSNRAKISADESPIGVIVGAGTRALEYQQWGSGVSVTTQFGKEQRKMVHSDYLSLLIDEETLYAPFKDYNVGFMDPDEPERTEADFFISPNDANEEFNTLHLPLFYRGEEQIAFFDLMIWDNNKLVLTERVKADDASKIIIQNDGFLFKTNFIQNQLRDGFYQISVEAQDSFGDYYRTQKVECFIGEVHYLQILNYGDFRKIHNARNGNADIVFMHESTKGDWTYEIRDYKDELVYAASFNDTAVADIAWKGVHLNERVVPDGIYTYHIFQNIDFKKYPGLSEEQLQNRKYLLTAKIETVLIDSDPPSTYLQVEPLNTVFNTSSQVRIFPYLMAADYDKISDWYFMVVDEKLNRIYTSDLTLGKPVNFDFRLSEVHNLGAGNYWFIGVFSNGIGDVKIGLSKMFVVE